MNGWEQSKQDFIDKLGKADKNSEKTDFETLSLESNS